MSPRRCDTCFKTYAHRQSLFKHRKKCKGAYTSTARLSLPTVVDFKLSRVDRKQQHLRGDVPTFDGAEFCGEKPLSRVTLYKMMEMLNIPKERRERIAREEERYQKARSSQLNELALEETTEDFGLVKRDTSRDGDGLFLKHGSAIKTDDSSSDESDCDEDESNSVEKVVHYLPSSLNEMMDKLKVLVGEYTAGNTTVLEQIMTILKRLYQTEEISFVDYKMACKDFGCSPD